MFRYGSRGLPRKGLSGYGMYRDGSHGVESNCRVCRGTAVMERIGWSALASVRNGSHGKASHGEVVPVVWSGQRLDGQRCEGQSWIGVLWHAIDRHGMARQSWIGSARLGALRNGVFWIVMAVLDSHGSLWIVSVRYGTVGQSCHVPSSWAMERIGKDGRGSSSPSKPDRKENTMTIKEKLAELEAERKRNKERVLKWKEQNK